MSDSICKAGPRESSYDIFLLERMINISCSYKKHPICSNYYADKKFAKRQANKKIRSTDEISNGKQYRKISESWNIADYHLHWTEEKARDWYRENPPLQSKYKNEDEYIKKVWFHDFKRK